MSAAWLTALSSLALAVIAVLGWLTRHTWRLISRTAKFLDDYFGEPGRPGVPERLGVMARLQALERTLADVRAETKPNGGTSLRDVVHRMAEDVSDIKVDQAMVRQDQALMRQRMEQLERQREKREGGNDHG